MRIKINFKGSNTAYENNNLKQVKGWFEDNVIGRNNDIHNKFSNYSLSPMMGGKRNGKYISYPDGGYVYFTTNSGDLMLKVTMALFNMVNTTKVGDLEYRNFEMVKDFHIHSDYDLVRTISPILLKVNHKQITVNDDCFLSVLKERCVKKLIDNGVSKNDANTLSIDFFHKENAKVVNMQYNNIHNLTTKAMFVIKGNRHAREILYNMGIGSSTGCGFGTVSINE